MNFINSKYYNEEPLGTNLYGKISYFDEIFTIQNFFDINDNQKEYLRDGTNIKGAYYNYKLVVYEDYYELDCQDCDEHLYLIFDKPVRIIGEHCINVVAPVIIIKSKKNNIISYCVANKVIIDNGYENFYYINNSKVNNLYFHSPEVYLNKSEINNLFILNQELIFDIDSKFLNYHKIRCFGKNDDLKENLLKNENFKNGIIHIE